METKKGMKVIIDADPGVDDVVAMGQVLSRKDIEVLAVTCVCGNVNVDQTTINALRVVEAFGRSDVKVFKGASSPILRQVENASHFHGKDGLGDVFLEKPDMSPLQDEHAVLAINRLVHEHRGEITLIALGPLTNIALAARMNKNLSKDLKEVIIMGGNYKGIGNVTMAAEFNFYYDSIAAHIVLEDLCCPKYLVSWELTRPHYLTLEDLHQYCSHDNSKSKFMKKLFESLKLLTKPWGICDSVAAAIATNREIITNSFFKYGIVDTDSSLTKGMVVILWDKEFNRTKFKDKKPNIIIVDKINVDLYRTLFLNSVK